MNTIINIIADRAGISSTILPAKKEEFIYNPKELYNALMMHKEEEVQEVSRAMDEGTERDVKNALHNLIEYIFPEFLEKIRKQLHIAIESFDWIND